MLTAIGLVPLFGIGLHLNQVTDEQLRNFKIALFIANFFYVGTGPSIKISALLMYQRVFATQRFRLVATTLIVVCLLWYVAETLASIWNCVPIQGFWDESVKAKCIDGQTFDLQFAIINIGLDVIILALPVRMITALQLSRTQKVAFCGLFLMGGL